VHGAFADGTSWRPVIPMVKKAGLDVISVQLPLDTLDRDVAFTERALDLAEAPAVLVGHDWGGMVVTEAGLHPKVKSLVYIAAYIPDAGQSLIDTSRGYPELRYQAYLQRDARGYVKLSNEGVFQYLAADLPRSEQEIVAATQGSIYSAAFMQPVTRAAWRMRPSFVLVTTNDSIVPPQLQRDQAKRAGAPTYEVASSHMVTLSHPEAVAKVILDASR
jgi:pimeloyl-ACP methyl ester carboxylesterase